MSLYRFLADGVVIVHGVFVGIVVLGLAAILGGGWLRWRWVRNFWFRVIHLGMIALVVGEALLGIPCPLTVIEDDLRIAGGETVAVGSFVGRCVHNLIFYDAPPWVFTVTYCLFGSIVLATMIWLPPRLPFRRWPPS